MAKAGSEAKANKDMNHRTKSVVRHMVEGGQGRGSYFFSQPLNCVEFLLQRQTCISQDVEAAGVEREKQKDVVNNTNIKFRVNKCKVLQYNSHQLSFSVVKNPCMRSRLDLYKGAS